MRATSIASCLWPGLTRLWLSGDWPALGKALVFGVGLNLVLVSSFVWPNRLPSWIPIFGWLVLTAVWITSGVRAYREFYGGSEQAEGDDRGLFLQAQGEYLKGHWYEAESLLQRLLRRPGGDVDAQLMLATLLRRTRRYDEALRQLRVIESLDGAEKWRWEVEQERRMLRPFLEKGREETQPTTSS